MRQAGPPHFSKVAIFPCQFYATSSIEVAAIEAIMARTRRLLDRDNNNFQMSMQDEVDEFFQCMAVMIHLPQPLYNWWVLLEQRYIERKLEAYIAHLKPLCKQYNIAVVPTPEVPWKGHVPTAYMCTNANMAAIRERDP